MMCFQFRLFALFVLFSFCVGSWPVCLVFVEIKNSVVARLLLPSRSTVFHILTFCI